MEAFSLVLFVLMFLFILKGYPVAFTLGGLSTVIGIILMYFTGGFFSANTFHLLGPRISGIMSNQVLMAVPLFIYMGIVLEKSGLAENMLESMSSLFGNIKGGLAISVIVVGAMLAASTGIVGATVVTMGMISLPLMLKNNYPADFSSGTIVSSGTLGQIIPPSIVLVLLADTMSNSAGENSHVDVGTLFQAALIPGFLIVAAYILYILLYTNVFAREKFAKAGENIDSKIDIKSLITSFIIPFFLIGAVLGTIFLGIASPTEAAGIGAAGAMMLAFIEGELNWSIIEKVNKETMYLTSMVFFVLIGASCFSLLFRTLGGDEFLMEIVMNSDLGAYGFLLIIMIIMFLLGFFLDFIEIIFILVPVVTPLFEQYDLNLVWIGILIALNLQASFLTPPFGFSLFYLKGVAPEEVKTQDIYRGAVPYIIIQVLIIAIVALFPELLGIPLT